MLSDTYMEQYLRLVNGELDHIWKSTKYERKQLRAHKENIIGKIGKTSSPWTYYRNERDNTRPRKKWIKDVE